MARFGRRMNRGAGDPRGHTLNTRWPDLAPAQQERLNGLMRLELAKQGPVRHVDSALVLRAGAAADTVLPDLGEELDPELRRRSEKAAEDVVVACETARGWQCQGFGHLKIGFDIRSLGPADPQTGYRDPVNGIRRIEVKGRRRGQPISMTTNEWYKAAQLGDSYWLYVVWDPLDLPAPEVRQAGNCAAEPVGIQDPAALLHHVKREVVAARYYDIPAQAVEMVWQQNLYGEGDA